MRSGSTSPIILRMSEKDVEDATAAFVRILLNRRWISSEGKHLVSSDDRSLDRLN